MGTDGSRHGQRTDPALRRLLVGICLSAVGNGLTLPLLVVYLHDVRGLSTSTAGFVVAYLALVQLVLVPAGGWAVDRVGPRPILLVGLVIEAVGVGLLATVHSVSQAFAVATVVAVGGSIIWAPQSALIGRMVRGEERQRVFGIQFMLLNLGIGVGGLVSAALVDVARPETFERLYLVDAATYGAYVIVLLSLRGVGMGPSLPVDGEQVAGAGGYRDVVRDRSLLRLVAVGLVMLTAGYGSLEVGVPIFATQVAGLSVAWIGVAYACNTFAIVAVQLVVLRAISGRSRTRVMALVGVLWAVCWLVMGIGGLVPGTLAAGLALSVGVVVFAVGESLWSPVNPALLNDLAPEHLRGRYNAVGSVTWGVTGALGPAIAGAMLGAGLVLPWLGLVVAACLVAATLALRLRRHLSPEQDGRSPVPGAPSAPGARMAP